MYSEAKVLLGKGRASGAKEKNGEVEYYLVENGAVRAYRYATGDKTADGVGRLIGYADAYTEGDRAVAYRRGVLVVGEKS